MTSKPVEFSPPRADQPCPCGSSQTFAQCCQPILTQQRPAATAEQLMRSRFTAHVAHDFAHLHRTYLETAREPYVPDPEADRTAWTRLVIHAHEVGARPDTASVDFTAYFRENDAEQAFQEKAGFQRVEGMWFYRGPIRQGPPPIKSAQAKVGRNDPCPCGSRKKYKKCCLNEDAAKELPHLP